MYEKRCFPFVGDAAKKAYLAMLSNYSLKYGNVMTPKTYPGRSSDCRLQGLQLRTPQKEDALLEK